jgi:hypothetical protein
MKRDDVKLRSVVVRKWNEYNMQHNALKALKYGNMLPWRTTADTRNSDDCWLELSYLLVPNEGTIRAFGLGIVVLARDKLCGGAKTSDLSVHRCPSGESYRLDYLTM